MKVQDIMTRSVRSCSPEVNLATAATMMWDGDCGVIPVVNKKGKVEGIITDRDICIAVATKGRRADEIHVSEVMAHNVKFCTPEDDPQVALALMRDNKVHRLAVIDSDGALKGMLSINDLILEAQPGRARKKAGPSYPDVMEALKAICAHREAIVPVA